MSEMDRCGNHTQFKDSPVGKIPVEWEVSR